MKKSFTKLLVTIGIILCATMLVVHLVTYLGASGISDKINANPSQYPENFGLEIGLGLVLTLVYMWIFHGVFLVFLIPNIILKNRFVKKPIRKNKTLDIVFTLLMAISAVPSLFYGVACCSVIFKALSYGLGLALIPFVVFIVAQFAYVVACIVDLVVSKAEDPCDEVETFQD